MAFVHVGSRVFGRPDRNEASSITVMLASAHTTGCAQVRLAAWPSWHLECWLCTVQETIALTHAGANNSGAGQWGLQHCLKEGSSSLL